MRWYFALDEAGSHGPVAEHARLAVLSAGLVGNLSPRLLYYGARNDFTRWMEARCVEVIDAEPPALDAMREAQTAGRFRAHSVGHWLRLAIPAIDRDADFALYTDCDIVFRRPFDLFALKPRVFAAAPEFAPDRWNYFSSGVMLLNLAAMRDTAPYFEDYIRTRLAEPAVTLDDQDALNKAYRGHWDRLDQRYNWKPYWPFDRNATILHFHGPKLAAIEAICAGRWNWDNPVSRSFGALLDAHLDHYRLWLADLGDRLQLVDFDAAFRLQRLASEIAAYARTRPARELDLSFMQFRLFPEDSVSS